MPEISHRLRKRMIWAGRILGFMMITFDLVIIIWSIVDHQDIFRQPMPILYIIAVVGLSGLIISWWKESIASLFLLLVLVGIGVNSFLYYRLALYLLIFGLPCLIVSILFFISWRLSKKKYKDVDLVQK